MLTEKKQRSAATGSTEVYMLRTAIAARLPLITCTTTDSLNAEAIIKHLSGMVKLGVIKKLPSGKQTIAQHAVTIGFGVVPRPVVELIEKNVEHDRTLIIVNPEEPIPEAFNAGEIPVPEKLVRLKLEKEYKVVPVLVPTLMAALGGLTLKEVDEVCRLAQAETKELTPESVRTVRRYATQVVPGVRAVDTDFEHYFENEKLTDWFEGPGQWLLRKDTDTRLRPRGLVLRGDPGTGKTLGSKWLARAVGVPLFRLDVGALMSKYVGESEANLTRALQVVEHNAPCVMLIDEVEKLFIGDDDSGVTQNLLAGLLWWLQEHRAQVLTVMTTNDMLKLPKELVRPGRIDDVIDFDPLKGDDVHKFVDELLGTFGLEIGYTDVHYNTQPIAHAVLTKVVLEAVRKHLLTNGDDPD